jgi:hypothetical protein
VAAKPPNDGRYPARFDATNFVTAHAALVRALLVMNECSESDDVEAPARVGTGATSAHRGAQPFAIERDMHCSRRQRAS